MRAPSVRFSRRSDPRGKLREGSQSRTIHSLPVVEWIDEQCTYSGGPDTLYVRMVGVARMEGLHRIRTKNLQGTPKYSWIGLFESHLR